MYHAMFMQVNVTQMFSERDDDYEFKTRQFGEDVQMVIQSLDVTMKMRAIDRLYRLIEH